MSKIIGGPVTQEERSATRATDLWKGMDCGKFDPEKSDHIHGRGGSPALLFSAGRGLDTRQFCPDCGMRLAWCECAALAVALLKAETMSTDDLARLAEASEC